MRCGEVEAFLVEYLDGGLAPGPSAAVREHLAGCAGCTALQGDLRAALALAHADMVPEPPAGTWERFGADVREKIRRAEAAEGPARPASAKAPQPQVRSPLPRPPVWERLSGRLRWPRRAPAYAVGVAVAASVLLYLGVFRAPPGPPVPEPQLAMVRDLEVLRGLDRPEDLEILRGAGGPEDLEMIERLPALLALVGES